MEKKELGREDVIEALKKIAFGRVNRGVELTYLSEPTAQLIRKMDLSAVAEFKRNANGTVEVKFVDRVKALSALYEMLGAGDANEAAEFLEALEQAGEERDDWRPFSAKQKTAMTWWANPKYKEYDAIICDGAVRSGKTLSMGMGFFLWAMRRFSGEQFALCGKTIVSLRRNVLHEILPKVTALGFHCEEKRSENLVIVRSGGRENRFYLFGGYDEGSAALIQGVTLAGVLFDEAALMPRSFVEQASARCSVSGSKLWFNCNPEGPMHWFYREWILRAEERGALYLHFTMDDNPSLSPRIRARYEKAYSGTFYRRFILGEWTAAKGLIYDFFAPQEYCARVPEKPWERVRISIDYGTVNPASFGLWALKDGVWYRAREYYFDSRREGQQKTDAEYVADLKKFAAGETVEKVIVDPSAASFIEALRREGFPVSKADNDVADGIRVTANLLKQRKIVICEGCESCLAEIAAYCWEDSGTGRDRPKKERDHAMDEMRYFAVSIAKKERGGGIAMRAVERAAR